MNNSTILSYESTDDNAKFRESYRFVFSAAIVATYFVVPDKNILWQCLGYVVGTSAFFSASYLIMSAAKLKYRDTGRMYEIFSVNESLRMRAFDWSIHVFGAALLFFPAILLAGLTFNLLGVEMHGWAPWLVVIIYALISGASIILVEHLFSRRKIKSSKELPRI